MSKDFKYDVFLSHSGKDKPIVRELAQRLKDDGLHVWFDEWEIRPGDSIVSKVDQALEESRTLVLAMSAGTFGSDWTMLEHHTWIFLDPSNEDRRFIPVRLDDNEIKDQLKQFAYVDWRNRSDEEYARLLSACRPFTNSGQPMTKQKTLPLANSVLKGHTAPVGSVAVTQDGRRIISGSFDKTIRVWDLNSGKCTAVLKGHISGVNSVAVTPDGSCVISGSFDETVRVWDLKSRKSIRNYKGHINAVLDVSVTPDGKQVISGSEDQTVRVWDLNSGKCIATFEGHNGGVRALALTFDGKYFVSGSVDQTARLWDLKSGKCIAILEGHTSDINGVAITSDGKWAVSGSQDGTLRLWSLPVYSETNNELARVTRYTNAKVIIVGDSGVGKTGLAIRLTEDRFEPTMSTNAVWATQMRLDHVTENEGIEREIWLWDFAGQSDYRLIHQLYLDETALAILVFNPQSENLFESLSQWDSDLQSAARRPLNKLLIAGRCDRGGLTVSREIIEHFCKQHGYIKYLETSAYTGEGCDNLRNSIVDSISWDEIPWTASPRIFKLLKEEIIKLKDEGKVLLRLEELMQQLEIRLSSESFSLEDLRAVIGLLAGPGIVWQLEFGDFILLQPELINVYAAAVIRTIRAYTDEIGSIFEESVLSGDLKYTDTERLQPDEEQIVLRAMHQMLINRSLCLRQDSEKGTVLVFPSYFKRQRPELKDHPPPLVYYYFNGPLDEIYATLIVRLHYTSIFEIDQLWRFAADFKTKTGHRLGLEMTKRQEGGAELGVYFHPGTPDDIKVIFIRYINDHLKAKTPDVIRLRNYACPHCGTPVESRGAVQSRLSHGFNNIICVICERPIPLVDIIEQKFASDEFQLRVQELEDQARIRLDNESRELILLGHTFAIVGEAGQIFRQFTNSDRGIDGEIEFKDNEGLASGKRVYLLLKSGDSYLQIRKRDGKEVFVIKNPRHIKYWQAQACPVMLVIRTSDGQIRWMNITDYLKQHRHNVKQIIFDGELFTPMSVLRLRDRMIKEEAREAREQTNIGMRYLDQGRLDEAMAQFQKSMSLEHSNIDAREGLFTVARQSVEVSPSRIGLALATLLENDAAWLAKRLCTGIEFLDTSMGPSLTISLRMHSLPTTYVAAESNGFGWDVQATAVNATGDGEKTRTLPVKANKADNSNINLIVELNDLPWGLYVFTIRFSAGGQEYWRAEQTLSVNEPKNPYIAGPPIRSSDLFFGRRELLNEVRTWLESYSVILLGPRRSGKTSFLYQLAEAKGDDRTVTYIDLHTFAGDSGSSLVSGLRQEILRGCLKKSVKDAPVDLRELQARIQEAGVMKLLILLDEMAVLAKHPPMALQLRAMSKWQEPETRLVIAGTASDFRKVTHAVMDSGSSPFNEFRTCKLEEITRQYAQDLLVNPVLGYYRYEVDAIEEMLMLGGGRPFFLNALAQLAFRFVQTEKGRVIRLSHVESARREAMYELGRWFQEFISELDKRDQNELPELVEECPDSVPSPYAEALQDVGLTVGPRHESRLCPLFKDWWNSNLRKETKSWPTS